MHQRKKREKLARRTRQNEKAMWKMVKFYAALQRFPRRAALRQRYEKSRHGMPEEYVKAYLRYISWVAFACSAVVAVAALCRFHFCYFYWRKRRARTSPYDLRTSCKTHYFRNNPEYMYEGDAEIRHGILRPRSRPRSRISIASIRNRDALIFQRVN